VPYARRPVDHRSRSGFPAAEAKDGIRISKKVEVGEYYQRQGNAFEKLSPRHPATPALIARRHAVAAGNDRALPFSHTTYVRGTKIKKKKETDHKKSCRMCTFYTRCHYAYSTHRVFGTQSIIRGQQLPGRFFFFLAVTRAHDRQRVHQKLDKRVES
jgi:hypothetical protein